jgi:hypothetical protein
MKYIKSKKLLSILAILITLSFAASILTPSNANTQPPWYKIDNEYTKGLSETTVSVSKEVTTAGSSVLITGTVIDISPDTEKENIKLRFPNGVAVVGDESINDWMRYVYEQYEQPLSVKGAEIKVFAYDDTNEKEIPIGTTESDRYGTFSITWKPQKEGTYDIYAIFEGTNSYYGSYANTTIEVTPAYQWYIIGTGITIIAIILISTLLIYRKRKDKS